MLSLGKADPQGGGVAAILVISNYRGVTGFKEAAFRGGQADGRTVVAYVHSTMNSFNDQAGISMKTKNKKAIPSIVSLAEWQAEHDRLLRKEKAATRARDTLAAERRRMPMAELEKDYVFEGP